MAQARTWYGRDTGLVVRMSLSMLLLAILYALFVLVLASLGVGADILVAIVAILLIVQLFFSDQIIFAASGARLLKPGQAPRLQGIVERLAQLADLPVPRLAVMPMRIPNAFTTGRNPKTAVITVTQGLLDLMDDDELEAVLAHEMSHIKNRDVAVIAIASFFAMVASFITHQFFLFGLVAEDDRDRRGGQAIMLMLLVSAIVWAISYILIRMISRYREYLADRGSAILTGHPAYLASALRKIERGVARSPTRDLRQAEAFNAFFIFPAVGRQSLMEIFSTHPTIEHRLARLEQMQAGMNRPPRR